MSHLWSDLKTSPASTRQCQVPTHGVIRAASKQRQAIRGCWPLASTVRRYFGQPLAPEKEACKASHAVLPLNIAAEPATHMITHSLLHGPVASNDWVTLQSYQTHSCCGWMSRAGVGVPDRQALSIHTCTLHCNSPCSTAGAALWLCQCCIAGADARCKTMYLPYMFLYLDAELQM